MTYLEASQAPNDDDFLARVRFCMVKAAVAVKNEDPATEQHAARVALATTILNNAEPLAARFALAVMTNATLLAAATFAAIPDGDLEFATNEVYSAFLP